MKLSIRTFGAAVLLACLAMPAAQANVVVGGTRVVLPAEQGEVTVRLSNANERPALVQAWIDRGDPKSSPDSVDTPFLVTPPMFRIEPQRDQNLRILYTGEALPADRESVFWLNVLEIPPKPSAQDTANQNYLQVALRSRIKLFFRPKGLAGDALKAPSQLTFRAVSGDGGTVLVVSNPTAYHVTLSALSVESAGKSYDGETGMVAPFAELRVHVAGLAKPPAAGAVVHFNAINDYGAPTPFNGATAP
ncbi:MAG: fimbria/pilus periplasmic chaperone [Moraxellaceae bacterium]|nr:fimbria/pilus periplasmic chaperone [Moraxellaceae bacterium]